MTNDVKIGENFNLIEFQSPDTKQVMLDGNLIKKLIGVRECAGVPIIINSGYRTPRHNAIIGGHPKSKHMEGKAADIKARGMDLDRLMIICETFNFTKILRYDDKGFLHVQVD